jgi:hypothetical protein
MASQAYTNTPKVRLIKSTTTLTDDTLKLDGLDAESVQALIDFFSNSGALTTVAITAEADNRGGYGKDGRTSVVKMVFSA